MNRNPSAIVLHIFSNRRYLSFFSDERNFSQNLMVNAQNNRWLSLPPTICIDIDKRQTPYLHHSVWDSDVMLLYIFLHSLRPNIEFDKCLQLVELPCIVWTLAGRLYILQQNSKVEEASVGFEKICVTTTPNIWPPNSLDCNPLDYYVCNTKDELKARITETFSNFKQGDCR